MQYFLVLVSAIVSTFWTTCSAQSEWTIEEFNNERLIKVLNSSKLLASDINGLAVRIYKLDNSSGSAGYSSSEVSHNLLVAISGFDENPEQNLYEIGPFLNPEFGSWIKDEGYSKEFGIIYGPTNNRKFLTLQVDLDKLTVNK